MLSPDHLLKLALAYSCGTGLGLTRISRRISPSNDKIFARLSRGLGVSTHTAIAVEEYFRANWPENAVWPPEVPGKPRKLVAAVISRRLKQPRCCGREVGE